MLIRRETSFLKSCMIALCACVRRLFCEGVCSRVHTCVCSLNTNSLLNLHDSAQVLIQQNTSRRNQKHFFDDVAGFRIKYKFDYHCPHKYLIGYLIICYGPAQRALDRKQESKKKTKQDRWKCLLIRPMHDQLKIRIFCKSSQRRDFLKNKIENNNNKPTTTLKYQRTLQIVSSFQYLIPFHFISFI